MIDKQTAMNLVLNDFNELISSRIVHLSDCNITPLDNEKFESSILDVRNRLSVKLNNNGKCSALLVNQLATHQCGLGELFIIKENKDDNNEISVIEFYQSSEILNLIENLETSLEENLFTSRNSPFEGKGISKTHHGAYNTLGASLVINVKNYWFKKNGQLHNDKEDEFDEIYKKYISGTVNSIQHAMHQKAIHSKKLTGEWLIYKRHNNINYYFCLAKHNEGDQEIYDNKILKCFQEFPELL
ncbi:hypothetical protein [Flavobacterium sp. CSZ]|uniref:hypothetical protein n=1 Tax=Flavobacterium sp. CSZ TaxID=2783791 RepID=UPI00188A80CF|nr:hypothetical protein [Flavobacterium sp. CSZ]MBF4485597.1 hypothetical protein [Flavobacterium sp. CSZ]